MSKQPLTVTAAVDLRNGDSIVKYADTFRVREITGCDWSAQTITVSVVKNDAEIVEMTFSHSESLWIWDDRPVHPDDEEEA